MQFHTSDMPNQSVLHVTPHQAESEAELNSAVKTPRFAANRDALYSFFVKALIEKTKRI